MTALGPAWRSKHPPLVPLPGRCPIFRAAVVTANLQPDAWLMRVDFVGCAVSPLRARPRHARGVPRCPSKVCRLT
jgi:hypothetical protein